MASASVLNAVQAGLYAGVGSITRTECKESSRFARNAKSVTSLNETERHLAELTPEEIDSIPGRVGRLLQEETVTAGARVDASSLAETDLVAAAKNGDEIAFEELVTRDKRRIYLRALRIVGSPEDAEDALQSALLKAFLHLPEFEGKSSFSTWFTRIAINEALMLRRTNRRRIELSIDDSIPADDTPTVLEIVDARPNPEHLYAQLEWREIVNCALSVLKPAMRLTLLIHGVDECSIQQTAEMLGVTVSAAKSRISRAQRELHKKIHQHLASADAV